MKKFDEEEIEDLTCWGGEGDRWRTIVQHSQARKSKDWGLCSSCKWFSLTKTETKVIKAYCNKNELHINRAEPVTECTSYVRVGEMTLDQMASIAWKIEGKSKNKVGF